MAGPGGRKRCRMKSATTHMAALRLLAMQDVEVNLKLASNFFASHEAQAWDMHSSNSPVNDPRWKAALANPAVTGSVRTGLIP